MIVSLIQSNAGNFGSGLVAEHTGFALQNRGSGFPMESGQSNSLAGHKLPLHTIIPAMMQKDGKTIGFGIMSGFNQAPAQAQFVANIVDFDMNLQAAMDADRFNKGNFGCTVNIEDGYPREAFEQLSSQGHQVNLVPCYSMVMGRGNAVMHDDATGVNFGASDPRSDGQATPEQPPSDLESPPAPLLFTAEAVFSSAGLLSKKARPSHSWTTCRSIPSPFVRLF